MQKAWEKAFVLTLFSAAACSSLAIAGENPNARNITYEFHQSNIFNPSYEAVWSAMADVYKNSIYAKNAKNIDNPLIGIAEVPLNTGGQYEIIAFPPEDEEHEKGEFCKANNVCPHYVLEARGNNIRTLGVIYANTVDRGDTIVNGYWTLKAFPYDGTDPAKAAVYDVYEYDKTTDRYAKRSVGRVPQNTP